MLGLALILGAAGIGLNRAWQATVRREAYLPALAAQARRSPYDGPLLALLGGQLAQVRQWPAAMEMLRRAIATGEADEDVWLTLASATAASGDPIHARADLRLGLRAFPNSASLQAALTHSEEPAPTSDALAEAICPQCPQRLVAARTRGSLLNSWAQWWGRRHPETSGFATRREWIERQPDNAQAQRLWGLGLIQNERLAEAGVALQRAVTLAPDSPAARLALADWLGRVNLPGRAVAEYLRCLKLRPKWLPALLGLGSLALDNDIHNLAASAYGQATKAAPQSAEAWAGLARAYQQTNANGRLTLSTFETAARLDPMRTDFLADYAVSLNENGRAEEAEALLRRRLAAAPDDARVRYLLAGLLTDNAPSPARESEAEAQLREALRLIPHVSLAEVRLSQLLLRQNKTGEAIRLLRDALTGDPFNVNAMRILARAYGQAGQTALADRISEQSNILFRDQQRLSTLKTQAAKNLLDARLHAQLADLYERVGLDKKAEYERALVNLIRTDPKLAAQKLKEKQETLEATLQ